MWLYDMHCHLDSMDSMVDIVEQAEAHRMKFLSVTVTPGGYEKTKPLLEPYAHVARVALGLHPWWMSDGRCGEPDVERFEELAPHTRAIGEVGLDFGSKHAASWDAQVAVFDRMMKTCAAGEEGKLISLHAVRSAQTVLDILEKHACPQKHRCIMHWYSDSSQELTRAIKLGCYFSIGEYMLATKRGREYAKAIPARRILLETDAPESGGGKSTLRELKHSLKNTLAIIEDIRGEEIGPVIEATSQVLWEG